MEEWIAEYWVYAALAAISGAIGATWKQTRAVRAGIRALLRDRIIQAYNYRMDAGYCPIYALTAIDDMYTQYKALKGNGAIDELMEKIQNLPTKKQEEN
jgi:hypothetical protein